MCILCCFEIYKHNFETTDSESSFCGFSETLSDCDCYIATVKFESDIKIQFIKGASYSDLTVSESENALREEDSTSEDDIPRDTLQSYMLGKSSSNTKGSLLDDSVNDPDYVPPTGLR